MEINRNKHNQYITSVDWNKLAQLLKGADSSDLQIKLQNGGSTTSGGGSTVIIGGGGNGQANQNAFSFVNFISTNGLQNAAADTVTDTLNIKLNSPSITLQPAEGGNNKNVSLGLDVTKDNTIQSILNDIKTIQSKLYWLLDDDGNIYTTYDAYSQKGISAYGKSDDSSVLTGVLYLRDLLDINSGKGEDPSQPNTLLLWNGSTWSYIDKSSITGLDIPALASYLTANNYAKKSDIPSHEQYLVKGNIIPGENIAISVVGNSNDVMIHNTYKHPTATETTIVAESGKALASITVNKFGHVTSVASKTLQEVDIPNISWSKILNTPTTLAGYGITDGVNNVDDYGTGNAVTKLSVQGHTLVYHKEHTFLTKLLFDELFEKVNIGTDLAPKYAIRAKYGLYSDQFISALGLNSDGGTEGGGLIQVVYSYANLDDTFDDTNLTDTFNAYTIARLARRITSIENGAITSVDWAIIKNKPATFTPSAHKHTKSEITDFAHEHLVADIAGLAIVLSLKSNLDHTHSQYLTQASLNGYATESWVTEKNYATTSDLDSRINALVNGAPAAYDTLKEIADVLAGNVNSISDILLTLSKKADKTITFSVGAGLSGGGNLTSNRTISLLPATTTTLGGIKVGDRLSITTDGVLNATYTYTHPTANAITVDAANMRVLSGITVNELGHVTRLLYKNLIQEDIPSLNISKIINLLQSLNNKLEQSAFDDLFEKVNVGTLLSPIWAIRAKYGFYSDSFVSAMGLNDDTSGGGVSALSELIDVSLTTLQKGLVLKWNGTHWANANDEGTISISWGDIVNKPSFAVVATSGSYNDLTNKPTTMKNPNALTFGSKTYDGSAAATITAADLGALTAHQTLYTLTLQRNGTSVGTFKPTANTTLNINAATSITVPTGLSVAALTTGGVIAISYASGYAIPTTAKQGNWDKVYNWYSGITAADTDSIINKWDEIISFLSGISDTSTLDGLINGINTNIGKKADKTISINAGTGLSGGGDLSANRTLSLATSGVMAGTYTKVTVDAYGRVTVGTTLSATDIPMLAISKISNLLSTLDTKALKTTTIIAGNGLTGGGDLSTNRTINVASANDGILVNADNIQLNTINALNSTSTTRALSAALGKKVWDHINDLFEKVNIGTSSAPVYAIRAKYGFYSDGFISAMGLGDSSSGDVGVTLLSELEDVSLSSPLKGQVLKYNGTYWVNAEDSGGIANISIKLNGTNWYPDGNGLIELPNYPTIPNLMLETKGTGNAITSIAISGHTIKVSKDSTFSLSSHSHAWNSITGKPGTFTPTPHTHDYASTVKVGSASYSVSNNVISLPAYPTSLPAYLLYSNPSGRPTSANIDPGLNYNTIQYFLSSSSMTTAKPLNQDGYILQFNWDNSHWGAQLALTQLPDARLAIRSNTTNTADWSNTNWIEVVTEKNISNYRSSVLEGSWSRGNLQLSYSAWYRVGEFFNDSSVSPQAIIMINRSYNSPTNEGYTFSVSVGYNGEMNVSQLSGVIGGHIITKVRVGTNNKGKSYFDIYVEYKGYANTLYVTSIGAFKTYSNFIVNPSTADQFTFVYDTVVGIYNSYQLITNLIRSNIAYISETQTNTLKVKDYLYFKNTGNISLYFTPDEVGDIHINQHNNYSYTHKVGYLTNEGKLLLGGSLGGKPSITLALGDNDTGLNWVSDGVIQLFGNSKNIAQYSGTGLISAEGYDFRATHKGVYRKYIHEGEVAGTLIRSYEINLTAAKYSSSNFYPLLFNPGISTLHTLITHATTKSGSAAYNMNRLRFSISQLGWADQPKIYQIHEAANFSDSEVTIGSLAIGQENGYTCIWLRGGERYLLETNAYLATNANNEIVPSVTTAKGNEVYSVGTGLSGNSSTNAKVTTVWVNDAANRRNYAVITNGKAYKATNICIETNNNAEINKPHEINDYNSNIWLQYDTTNNVTIGNTNGVYNGKLNVKGDVYVTGMIKTSGSSTGGLYTTNNGLKFYERNGSWTATAPIVINEFGKISVFGLLSADYALFETDANRGYLFANPLTVSGNIIPITSTGSYDLGSDIRLWNDLYLLGWVKTLGETGWLNTKYGGGWYMKDTDFIRIHGGKSLCLSAGGGVNNKAGVFIECPQIYNYGLSLNAISVVAEKYASTMPDRINIFSLFMRQYINEKKPHISILALLLPPDAEGSNDYNRNKLEISFGQIDQLNFRSQVKFQFLNNGNLYAAGTVTQNSISDIRLKENFNYNVDYCAKLLQIGDVVDFTYIDCDYTKRVGVRNQRHTGIIYQQARLANIYGLCNEDESGYGGVNSLSSDFLFTMLGAVQLNIKNLLNVNNSIAKHESELERLRRENEEMKKRIAVLEESNSKSLI